MKAVRTVSLLFLLTMPVVALQSAEDAEAPGTRTEEPRAGDAGPNTEPGQEEEAAGEENPTGPASTVMPPPADGRDLMRSVSGLAEEITEISISLDWLHHLVVVALGLSVINIVFTFMALLPWRRRHNSRKSAQNDTRDEETQVERSPEPLQPIDKPRPVTSLQDDPPSPSRATIPQSGLLEKTEKPQPPPAPAEPDEFAGLSHAAIGRALSRLHRALPDLAGKIPDPRQQERFLAELDLPLKARVERFKDATRRGDAYLKEHWIEQDLVTTLNSLAQMLSSVIEERYRGRRGNRALEDELLSWLYEQLAPVCRAEGWFAVESVLPFTTRFDPKIHHSVGSVEVKGADNLIVAIKAIGRRDARQGFVTHKAEVLVGR